MINTKKFSISNNHYVGT